MNGVGASKRYYHDYYSLFLLQLIVLICCRSMNFMPIDVSSCSIFQLGANAILAVSLAVCKAGALVKKIPLYQV